MKKKYVEGLLTGLASAFIVIAIVMIILLSNNIMFTLDSPLTKREATEDLKSKEEISKKIELLEAYISQFYLEEADKTTYAENIYKGLLKSLEDPYSVYYTKEEFAALNESSSGIYTGIGATVNQNAKTGIISIVKPFVNGPAYEAGLLPGDVLYKVEDEEVTGLELTEVVSRMKGKEKTTVKITVMRENQADPIEVTITRRKIEVPTIEYEMLADQIGYISVAEFEQVTAKQFSEALADLEAKGMKSLVVDLRNNPGGLLTTVTEMLDRILPEGMIVYTKDKYGEGEEYKSTDKEQYKNPMVVLINENSASASEVFAGAVQDYGIGTLVGTTSFGKGIVQSIIPLKDGTALKLTVSKYYTPKGRNIHEIGIVPEVEIELDEGLKQKVVIEKAEDNQLQKAISVLKEKMK